MTIQEMADKYAQIELIFILAEEILLKKEIEKGIASADKLENIAKKKLSLSTPEKRVETFINRYAQERLTLLSTASIPDTTLYGYSNLHKVINIAQPKLKTVPIEDELTAKYISEIKIADEELAFNGEESVQESFLQQHVEKFSKLFPTKEQIKQMFPNNENPTMEMVLDAWASDLVEKQLILKKQMGKKAFLLYDTIVATPRAFVEEYLESKNQLNS